MSAPVLVENVFEAPDDRASWLKARRSYGVGASELPAVLGVDERRGSLAIYAKKVVEGNDDEGEDEDDPRFWGRMFEEPVAQWYAQKTGRVVTNPGAFAIMRHPTAPLFATLDRDVFDPARPDADTENRGGLGVLECKAVSVYGPLDQWRSEPPLCYQVQLQAQLAVTGRAWGSIAAVLGGTRPVFFDFERNDRFIAAALVAVEQFWERVERRDPPPPDGTRETVEAIKQLWPEDSGQTITLPDLALVAEWEAAKEASRKAEAVQRDVESRIKSVMQEATWAALTDGRKVQWKVEPRKGHVVEASRPRVLRLIKK